MVNQQHMRQFYFILFFSFTKIIDHIFTCISRPYIKSRNLFLSTIVKHSEADYFGDTHVYFIYVKYKKKSMDTSLGGGGHKAVPPLQFLDPPLSRI
jgi:hypothetical protein